MEFPPEISEVATPILLALVWIELRRFNRGFLPLLKRLHRQLAQLHARLVRVMRRLGVPEAESGDDSDDDGADGDGRTIERAARVVPSNVVQLVPERAKQGPEDS